MDDEKRPGYTTVLMYDEYDRGWQIFCSCGFSAPMGPGHMLGCYINEADAVARLTKHLPHR